MRITYQNLEFFVFEYCWSTAIIRVILYTLCVYILYHIIINSIEVKCVCKPEKKNTNLDVCIRKSFCQFLHATNPYTHTCILQVDKGVAMYIRFQLAEKSFAFRWRYTIYVRFRKENDL